MSKCHIVGNYMLPLISLFCFKQIVKELVAIFPVLRDWIAEFLSENKCMIASDVGHNMLIEQVHLSQPLKWQIYI